MAEGSPTHAAPVPLVLANFLPGILDRFSSTSPTLKQLAVTIWTFFGTAFHFGLEITETKNNYWHS